MNEKFVEEIKIDYAKIKSRIVVRLEEFRLKWDKGSDNDIFEELVFCLLTPQSKARLCWLAVENLKNKGLLFSGDVEEISRVLNIVRFRNNKAKYIVEAQDTFRSSEEISIRLALNRHENIFDKREWLVKNVKGMGYKEASHFLRNIGFGEDISILDRHILKNLEIAGVTERVPKNLTRTRYLEIEPQMRKFSSRIEIPLSHLDFVLWYRETGEVFK
jgi:N-glycosylase/DNA lyase